MQNKNKKKKKKKKSKWGNGMRVRESVYGLSTYSYVCTGADEDRREAKRGRRRDAPRSPCPTGPTTLSLCFRRVLGAQQTDAAS